MLKNGDYQRGNDILNENYKMRMSNYFNPYEYNFENNLNYEINNDLKVMRSKNHSDRKLKKK